MSIVIQVFMGSKDGGETNPLRWIVRPTPDQMQRRNEIMSSDRYRNFSELLRQAINIGFDQIQKDILVNGFEEETYKKRVVRRDEDKKKARKK